MIYKRQVFLSIIAVFAILMCVQKSYATVYNVRNAPYNAAGNGIANDYPAIQDAVNDAIAAGPGNTVYIPAGTYLMNSNSSIYVNNVSGLTIQGDSTTELVDGSDADFFSINNSTNITATSLLFDRQILRSTQGTVNSISADGHTLTVTLSSGFAALNTAMFSSASSSSPLDLFFWTDPSTLQFDQNVGGPADCYNFTQVGSQWTVYSNSVIPTTEVGKTFVILNEGGGWPFSVNSNTGPITISYITDYGGGGSGACVGMSGNQGPILLSHVTIAPPSGSGRMLASAGGFTAQGNRGAITIDSCNISHTKDDILDTGTDLAHILSNPSGVSPTTTVTVENTENYYVGDNVQIWDWTYHNQHVRDNAKITAASLNTSTNIWTLTFDHAVVISHTGAGPGDTNWSAQEADGIDRCIDMQDAAPVTFTNNSVQNSGRILDMKSPNSVIANNTFYETAWCIFASAETFWHGGPAPTNLTIKNNTFTDIGWSPIELEVRTSYAQNACSNILIEGNTFNNCGAHEGLSDGIFSPLCDIRGGGIRLCSTNGATVRNNVFNTNWGPPIAVQNSENVRLQNNIMLGCGSNTWSDFNNYESYGVAVDMGADVWIAGSTNVTLQNNLVDRLGTYNTMLVDASNIGNSNIRGTSNGIYVNGTSLGLTNRYSGLKLEDAGSSGSGTHQDQYYANGGSNQKWNITASTSNPGYFTLQNATNSLYLSSNNSSGTGTNVILAASDGAADQLWKFQPTDAYYEDLVNKYSGLEVTATSFSTSNGLSLTQQTGFSGYDQQWISLPTDSTVARYAFDEGTGTSAYDSSGHGHTATLSSATWTSGTSGHAIGLSGSSQYVNAPSALLNTSQSFTVSTWIKLTNTAYWQTFVSQAGVHMCAFYLGFDGGSQKFHFSIPASDSTSATIYRAESVTTPVIGTWYHVTGVYNQAADTIQVYVNGVLEGTTTFSSGWTSSGVVRIGGAALGGDNVYGVIDDTRLYQSAFNAQQALDLYTRYDDAAASFRLDEGTGSTTTDASGHGFTGSIYNSPAWIDGLDGTALNLNVGSDLSQYVNTSAAILTTNQSFSVSAWVQPQTFNWWQTFVSQAGVNICSYYLGFDAGSQRFHFSMPASDSTSPTVYRAEASNIALFPNTWYHLVGVYDTSAGDINLYVNGVLQASTPFTTGFASSGIAGIGHAAKGGDDSYAAIDGVRFYSRALSAADVTALYNLVL